MECLQLLSNNCSEDKDKIIKQLTYVFEIPTFNNEDLEENNIEETTSEENNNEESTSTKGYCIECTDYVELITYDGEQVYCRDYIEDMLFEDEKKFKTIY